MKTLKQIAYLALVIPALWSCDNYEMPPIIPQTGANITIPAQGSSLALSLDNQDVMIPFTVSAADFGSEGEVTNVLQMDLVGASFANAVDLGTSTTLTIEVLTKKLNDALIAKGLPVDAAANAEFRVKSTFNQPMGPIFGETLTLSVTPYSTFVPFPLMYVPGDYQGWNPGNLNTTLKSVGYNTTYTGFVHILGGSGEFKFNEQPDWVAGKNYGDTGADGTLDNAEDASNIKVTEFGTYEVTVDLSSKTYTLSDPLLWGVIGDATAGGWDAETPMNFNRDLNVLTLTTDLKAGSVKFRANQSWDYNFGPKDGEMIKDGDNIAIDEAGNYTITLNFNEPGKVSYTLTEN